MSNPGQFKPGECGNPAGAQRVNGRRHGNVIHGAFTARTRHCDACGQEYTAHRLTSRYCSDECRISHGRYGRSYGAVVPRKYGFTQQ